jgi:RimJ/RimL family protein N-acetyltransferase
MNAPFPPLDEVVLTSERLMLRPMRDADAPVLAELANDIRVIDGTLTMPFPYTLEDAVAFIGHARESRATARSMPCAIERRSDGQFLGGMGLVLQPAHQRAELGYWLGVPFWGQGYATEAARALIDFGFETLGLNRIFAVHYHTNPASGRVMQRLGMTYEGTLRQHVIRFDIPRDDVCYGLLRPDWEAQRKTER